jgi:hypothetical protein
MDVQKGLRIIGYDRADTTHRLFEADFMNANIFEQTLAIWEQVQIKP